MPSIDKNIHPWYIAVLRYVSSQFYIWKDVAALKMPSYNFEQLSHH